jgi:hypothetical protein
MDFLVKMLYLWGSTMGEVRREQEQVTYMDTPVEASSLLKK